MIWLRKTFDFFLYSSLYISLCAVMMTWQTTYLLQLPVSTDYYGFVFFATICSYNFHWYLTPSFENVTGRIQWSLKNKNTHAVLYFVGVVGSVFFFYKLRGHWIALSFATLLTFLYSAPKIPLSYFRFLKQVAIGKTIFLSAVWTYVTFMLPVFIAGKHFSHEMKWFSASRFFLIYGICIVFDYRDRADDKLDGVRTFVNYFDEKSVDRIFILTSAAFVVFTSALLFSGLSFYTVGILLCPGCILMVLYRKAKSSRSDYLYYFTLDGLLMLSALLMALGAI